MDHENQSSLPLTILRWIAFLPGAFLAAGVTWFLLFFLSPAVFLSVGRDANSFFSLVLRQLFSSAAMGAAFVYIGAKIAPFHKKMVVYVLAALCSILAVVSLPPAIMIGNYWETWGLICLIFGAGATAYNVGNGATDLVEA